jgi:hypothetical protein
MRPRSGSDAAKDALNPEPAARVSGVMEVIKVRLSGDIPGITQALWVLDAATATAGGRLDGQTAPYRNRREPGYRVYLALRFPLEENAKSCGAAHRRQAIDRPAAAQSKEA